MSTKKLLILAGVAVGGYLVYSKFVAPALDKAKADAKKAAA